MASKLTIKEEHGGENMPLYYAVYDEAGRQVSMHYAREDAEVMAASRMMLKSSEAVLDYFASVKTTGLVLFPVKAEYVQMLINTAIAAAKGE